MNLQYLKEEVARARLFSPEAMAERREKRLSSNNNKEKALQLVQEKNMVVLAEKQNTAVSVAV